MANFSGVNFSVATKMSSTEGDTAGKCQTEGLNGGGGGGIAFDGWRLKIWRFRAFENCSKSFYNCSSIWYGSQFVPCQFEFNHVNDSRLKPIIRRFSIVWRKTKSKVIATANQNKGKHHKEPMRTPFEGAIGFSFASDCVGSMRSDYFNHARECETCAVIIMSMRREK